MLQGVKASRGAAQAADGRPESGGPCATNEAWELHMISADEPDRESFGWGALATESVIGSDSIKWLNDGLCEEYFFNMQLSNAMASVGKLLK